LKNYKAKFGSIYYATLGRFFLKFKNAIVVLNIRKILKETIKMIEIKNVI
jgi:hypothetical protein